MKRLSFFVITIALFALGNVAHAQTNCTCEIVSGAGGVGSSYPAGTCESGATDPAAPIGGSCTSSLQCGGGAFCVPAGYTLPSQTTAPTQTSPVPAATPTTIPTGSIQLTNPLNASSLTGLLQEVLGYVVELGSIFLVIMLVYVGFLFVSARGRDEQLTKARSALLWTVVGGLLLLGASALAEVITATVNSL